VEVKVHIESRSSVDAFLTAKRSLDLARKAKDQLEQEHHCVTGIVFCAFAIEAMINHFGQIYFDDWNESEANGGRKASHKRLFNVVGLNGYLGSSNYQKASICFKLRDFFAHGKTEQEAMTINVLGDQDELEIAWDISSIRSKGFRDISLKLLSDYVVLAEAIESDIQSVGTYPDNEGVLLNEYPLSINGSRSW
jgi:hypothetical protein